VRRHSLKIPTILLLSLALFLPYIVSAEAQTGPSWEYERATIYFVHWDMLTRSNLSVDDVRKVAWVVTQINNSEYASRFAKWLHLDKLKPIPPRQLKTDKRLVIDLVRQGGTTETYFADKAAFFSNDGSRTRTINDEFRRRFEIVR